MIARSLLQKDPAWVEENRQAEQRLNDLDSALENTDPQAPPATTPTPATPPSDWKPRIASFSIHSFGMSRVSFTSDAPLETIVGTTSKVSGDFSANLGDVTLSTTEGIQVEIASLRTGIDLRDEHLQGEGWFNSAAHPSAVFKLQRIEATGKQLWPGHTIAATLHGTLTIKGITRPVTAKASIGYHKWSPAIEKFGVKGDLVRIKADFEVKLSDYDMSAGVIGQKVAEVVTVSLNLSAIEQPPAEAPPAEAPPAEQPPAAPAPAE